MLIKSPEKPSLCNMSVECILCFVSEKAAPVDQDSNNPGNSSTQPLAIPNISYSKVVSESPAASLSNSPCQSPMLREEDEQSETGESEGEEDDEGPGPQWVESDSEVTEVDINDVDMSKVSCWTFLPSSFQNIVNSRGDLLLVNYSIVFRNLLACAYCARNVFSLISIVGKSSQSP